MNPWGFVVVALGVIVAWVGIRGTQGNLFADLFGHDYPDNPSAPPWSSGAIAKQRGLDAAQRGPENFSKTSGSFA